MPRPKIDNPETKARILEAAEALFAERGFEGVAVRQVAERAGVNTALIHYYFESKENLYRSVFLSVAGDVAAMALGVAELTGPAPERLRTYIRGFSRIVLTRPNRPRLIQRELLNGAPMMRGAIEAGLQPVHLMVLRRIVDEGIRTGELRRLDAQLLPLTILGMVVQFAIARPLIDVALGPVDYDDAFVDRVAEHVADTLLHGVLPEGTPKSERGAKPSRRSTRSRV